MEQLWQQRALEDDMEQLCYHTFGASVVPDSQTHVWSNCGSGLSYTGLSDPELSDLKIQKGSSSFDLHQNTLHASSGAMSPCATRPAHAHK